MRRRLATSHTVSINPASAACNMPCRYVARRARRMQRLARRRSLARYGGCATYAIATRGNKVPARALRCYGSLRAPSRR